MFKMTTEATGYAIFLGSLPGDELQKATARTLNAISLGAHAQQRKNLQSKLIVRAPYTMNSLKRYPASESKSIQKQNAIVGSTSPYLPIQDSGGIVRARSRRIPIPTNVLRGSDRRKRIAPSMRIGSNTRFFVLSPGAQGIVKAPGLYVRKSKKKIVKVRDLSQSQIRLKPTKWHTSAALKYAKFSVISGVFIREAKKVMPANYPKK